MHGWTSAGSTAPAGPYSTHQLQFLESQASVAWGPVPTTHPLLMQPQEGGQGDPLGGAYSPTARGSEQAGAGLLLRQTARSRASARRSPPETGEQHRKERGEGSTAGG